MQFDLFDDNTSSQREDFKIENGEYTYISNFFDKIEADGYLKKLDESINWQQEEMIMYGKRVKFPRLSSWHGDKGMTYSFSGIKHEPSPWNANLLEIKNKIEPKCEVDFNSVLLNLYRDGTDSMSWHADEERELGENPLIASVNFGAERVFQLKHNDTKERIDIVLAHGSLLIMKGELQHFWKHQIPKTKKKLQKRINLTYRLIKS